MKMAEEDRIPPCQVFIDKEGRWYHEGAEMIHRDIIRLFYQHMERDSQGRYIINWNRQRCYVEVEDTAFVVWRVVRTGKEASGNARFVLCLSDDSQAVLSPETLWVGPQNILYCQVRNQSFPARFSRAAYYQLAQYVLEEDGTYFLPLNGKRYTLLVEEGSGSSKGD
jgi:hypothetical protein